MPLAGAGAQDRQSFDPEQPVCGVFPAQAPPQRCWPAGQPMPEPALAVAETELVAAAPEVVVAVVLAPVVALVVAGSPPAPLVVAPGPSATLPPTPPPPKPAPPSLLALVSAALGHAADHERHEHQAKASSLHAGLRAWKSPISVMIAIVARSDDEKVCAPRCGLKFPSTRERWRSRLFSRRCRDRVPDHREKSLDDPA